MFERLSEQGRRAIMFAAQEACEFGSRTIAPEHMLLGLIRADDRLAKRFPESIEPIREQIQAHTPVAEKIAFGRDFQFSKESKRALLQAAEDADKMGDKQIGADHLLKGVMHDENSFAKELFNRNVRSD